MSKKKKQQREFFNMQCMIRDGGSCVLCYTDNNGLVTPATDVHHITSRDLMPNGGYVLSNGISLCSDCHLQVEKASKIMGSQFAFEVDRLYQLIRSSYPIAFSDSSRLK